VIPLAIWLVLIGYSIAWTGKMNLGVSYKAQADGSITPVDSQGQPARTYTLLDAVTCAAPSGSPPSGQGPAPQHPQQPTPPPVAIPNPIPQAQGALQQLPLPHVVPGGIELPGDLVVHIPTRARDLPRPGGGPLDGIAHTVHDVLEPFVDKLGGLLRRPSPVPMP